jgi:hypothetical protein
MIVINKGSETTFDLTLKDRWTITAPYYLMVLYGRGTNEVTAKFLITDTSSYSDRYQRFTVTEGDTFTALAAEYNYKILEKYTESTTITGSEVVLESGILRIVSPTDTQTSHTITDQVKAYERE